MNLIAIMITSFGGSSYHSNINFNPPIVGELKVIEGQWHVNRSV